jgi:hypothetical protein
MGIILELVDEDEVPVVVALRAVLVAPLVAPLAPFAEEVSTLLCGLE